MKQNLSNRLVNGFVFFNDKYPNFSSSKTKPKLMKNPNFKIQSPLSKEDLKHLFGSSFRDEIETTFDKIVSLLGEPTYNSSGDKKIDAIWNFKINDKFLSIYNYKNGKNHLGEKGLELKCIKIWNVSSNTYVQEEIEFLKEKLKE